MKRVTRDARVFGLVRSAGAVALLHFAALGGGCRDPGVTGSRVGAADAGGDATSGANGANGASGGGASASAERNAGAGAASQDAHADAGGRLDATPRPAAGAYGGAEPVSRLAPVGGNWIEKIDLGEGRVAYVTPPTGAREKRPVVVAVHGAVDDPGLMCGAWRLVADVYPFVVCPAGTPIGADAPGRKYVWGSSEQLEKRALEALAAVEAKYPDHVVAGAPAVYVAFSQGATMAAPFLARNAKRFPRVVLTEGGHRAFEPAALASSFAKAGGERVLFTCSHSGCAGFFEQSRAALERANVDARIVFSGAHGHSIPPPVRESIHAALPWVVEGLAGWEGYAAATKLPSH